MSDVVFFAVLLSTIALVWIFPVFPTQDGPAHLENARLLVETMRGDPTAARFFELDGFSPNWVAHLVLAPLLLVVPATVAEKLVLTIATVLVPLGFRQALAALGGPRVLALLGLPFAHSYLLTMGFLNFCAAVGVALFVVAHWARGDRGALGTAVGLVLTYALHPVAFVFAAVVLSSLAVVAGRVRATALALLPGIALVLWFLGAHRSEDGGVGPDRLALFASLGVLVSYAQAERTLSTLFWTLLGVVAVFEVVRLPWKHSWRDGLVLAAIPLLVAFSLVPFFFAGGGYVPERFLLCGALAIALWVGTRAPGALLPRVLGAAAVVTALGSNLVRVAPIRERNDAILEYTSVAPALEPHALVLAVNGSEAGEREGVTRVDSLRHAIGYLAVSRGIVDLTNYQPNTGHFPLRWKDDVTPFGRLYTTADLERVPPRVDLLRYERETGVAIDDVILFDLERDAAPSLFADLERGGYREVARSPRGRAVVWSRP